MYLVIFMIVGDTHLTNHDITVFAPYNLFLFELFMRLTVRSFLILTFFIPKEIWFCEEKNWKFYLLAANSRFMFLGRASIPSAPYFIIFRHVGQTNLCFFFVSLSPLSTTCWMQPFWELKNWTHVTTKVLFRLWPKFFFSFQILILT